MASRTTDAASNLAGPAIAVGGMFILLPILDTLAQVWPWAPGSNGWRYGTVGIGANFLISYVFGMALVCGVAALSGHRRTLRIFGILSAISAVLLVLAAAGFSLDAIQLRPAVPRNLPNNLFLFDTGAAKAVFKYLLSALVMGFLALRCRRAWRELPEAQRGEDSPLIVKRSS